MNRVPFHLLAASFLFASLGAAQAPSVEKVDPPGWWPGSTVNPVRVLIRGHNLAGARVECARVRCTGLRINAAGTYAFVDVTIPAAARPGRYPFTLRTPSGRAEVPFELTAPLARAGRFRGFGKNDVIYLIMPDRFANGDPGNDDPAVSPGLLDRTKSRFYHGGDLAGVRQRLPYLKALGITAIWLNPIYDNNNALNRREMYDNQPITDYHGYGATDFYAVDEHFGSLKDFRELVDAAHAQGIKIILDLVANHSGPYHPWVKDPPTPTWFHGTAERHLNNDWQTWTLADPHGTADTRRSTLDGWFVNLLPDLNQDDPEVARYIIQNSLWWVAVSGMDGIRQDTWPYVPRTFWRDWMTALRREFPALKVLGEVSDGNPALVSFFEGGRVRFDGVDDQVDMLYDYPLFYPLRRAFGEGRRIREVAEMLANDRMYRDPAGSLVTFLGLHDVPRFMNDRGATTAGLKLAYTFLLTTRGTPLLYYGDEIGLPGGGDPDNRRDFPGGWPGDPRNAFEAAGRTAEEQSVYAHLAGLLKLRAEHAELRGAGTENLVTGEQIFVYRRGKLIVALNNDTVQAGVRIPLGALGPDLLGICATPRIEGNAPLILLPKRSGCIFPVTAETISGPSLGVTGDRRLHPDFPSQFVAPRNVEVWLPPGYASHRAERYPVLYMHDGQNVFDPATSFGGVDWAADETMTRLIRQQRVRPAIVVAIWNTAKRYQEYMPAKPLSGTSHSNGFGSTVQNSEIISDAYLRFLVTELKPFIDRTYRTRPGRADTFTMGASMGGLISAYAMTQYPDVFGGAACLSTGWPVADGAVIEYLRGHAPDPATHRFYFDLGTATLDAMFPPWQARADSVLHKAGYVDGRNYLSRTFPGAEHNERAWRDRLEIPLRFLLGR